MMACGARCQFAIGLQLLTSIVVGRALRCCTVMSGFLCHRERACVVWLIWVFAAAAARGDFGSRVSNSSAHKVMRAYAQDKPL